MRQEMTSYLYRKKRFCFSFFLVMSILVLNAQENPQSLFNQGNTSYNEANYTEAVELYKQVLGAGLHSTELYYNLGSAYYRLNQVAESIYYFEKAKMLDPKNEDIKVNSSFAQNMTIDAIEPLPKSQIAQIKNRVFGVMSLDSWSKVSLGLLWLSLVLFLAYLFIFSSRLKRYFFFLSLLTTIVFTGSLAISFSKNTAIEQSQFAILFSPQLDIWSEPNQQGDLLFILHEGTKVQVLDSLAEWKKIRIANGSEGWFKNGIIKALND